METPPQRRSPQSNPSPAALPTTQQRNTTAEAIAAELAATQADRPAGTMSTYAPGNLVAGTGLRARKRRPGAGMKGFMTIAGDLFKS